MPTNVFNTNQGQTAQWDQIARERRALRQQLKQARSNLSPADQQRAAQQLIAQVLSQDWFKTCSTVALYHSFGAELDTGPLINALLHAGKRLCLPVLHPFAKGHLLMLMYASSTPLRLNTYGILEPQLDCRGVVPLAEVDCIFTPLVGFDDYGNRLGMGGGYYDRTLASWAQGRYPQLEVCGLAHDCQHVTQIPIQAWDVPLPRVITPTQSWRFTQQAV